MKMPQQILAKFRPSPLGFGCPALLSEFEKRKIPVPDAVAEYISKDLPEKSCKIDGVTWYGGRDFLPQHVDASPGFYVLRYGFWTIMRDYSGSAFCMDVTSGNAFVISPEWFIGKDAVRGWITGLRDEAGKLIRRTPIDRGSILRVCSQPYQDVTSILEEHLGCEK